MGKYNLTMVDIETGINRVLTEAYATATVSDKPELLFVIGGPGVGKTSVEVHLKKEFKERGERAFIVNSDKIAEFHPNYEEILEGELPGECYRITREFVRPATPKIFDKLREAKISIINENTLDKGESDIELARKFKMSGYKIAANIMATDFFESRLSCFEREANTLLAGLTPRGISMESHTRMYNGFVEGVRQLESMGLLDEINVYERGENINRPPILRYKKGDTTYRDFEEAVIATRHKQRKDLLSVPAKYLIRIQNAMDTIKKFGENPLLTEESLKGLEQLREDYLSEIAKEIEAKDK